MIAWDTPVTVSTAAGGIPSALVTSAGEMAIVIPDADRRTSQPLVLTAAVGEGGVVGHTVVARRNFSMLPGLAAASGRRVFVAGMQHRKSMQRGAVLYGGPAGRLRLLAHLPGPFSAPDGSPGPAPAAGVAVPTAIAGNSSGDIAVLISRRAPRGDQSVKSMELWVRSSQGHVERRTLAAPGPGLGPTALTMDAQGRVLAAWKRRTSIYAKVISGDSFATSTRRLGTAAFSGPISVALPRPLHAVVAWGVPAGLRGLTGPFNTYVAAEQPDHRFTPALPLGIAPVTQGGYGAGIEMSATADGNVAIAWTGGQATRAVGTATLTPDNLLLRGQDAAPGDLAAMTIDNRGNEVVLAQTADALTAAVRAAGVAAYSSPARLDATNPLAATVVARADRDVAVWRAPGQPVKAASGIFTLP